MKSAVIIGNFSNISVNACRLNTGIVTYLKQLLRNFGREIANIQSGRCFNNIPHSCSCHTSSKHWGYANFFSKSSATATTAKGKLIRLPKHYSMKTCTRDGCDVHYIEARGQLEAGSLNNKLKNKTSGSRGKSSRYTSDRLSEPQRWSGRECSALPRHRFVLMSKCEYWPDFLEQCRIFDSKRTDLLDSGLYPRPPWGYVKGWGVNWALLNLAWTNLSSPSGGFLIHVNS
jgi:hypothetical protein